MVEERTAELEAFYKITSDVSALAALDEVLSTAVERSAALSKADVAALLLREDSDEELTTRAVCGERTKGLAALHLAWGSEPDEGRVSASDGLALLGRRAARRIAPELADAMAEDEVQMIRP